MLESNEREKGAPEWFNRNVIVVMNPCKRRMMPSDVNTTQFESTEDFKLEDWDK